MTAVDEARETIAAPWILSRRWPQLAADSALAYSIAIVRTAQLLH